MFSISINGDLCGFFKGNRGLRQGDPLSPPLFLIAMEVLANILQSLYTEGNIRFHPLAKDPKITHLSFADDVMIFFDGNLQSLQGIADGLKIFEDPSGLGMNKDKTTLFYGGLINAEAESVSALGYQIGKMPIRYLGLPLMNRKLRVSEYSPLLDKLHRKFNSWSTLKLSFAGRLQLLKSEVYGLLNFWMSAFSLPKTCLSKITSLCTRFLWSGQMEKRGLAKVGWKEICLPQSEGGLGLRNLKDWNNVLMLRLVWLLFTNAGSLWIAWINKHYLKRGSFWSQEITSSSSWIWKSLLSIRHMAIKFLKCKIGMGNKASF